MWKFLSGAEPPLKKKKPMTEKAANYEIEKRERRLNESWKHGRPWLLFQGCLMFCTTCIAVGKTNSDFANSGCRSLRLESVKKHEQSDGHRQAVVQEDNKHKEVGKRPAEKALQKLTEGAFAKLEKLFRTCHALAMNCRPFTDYVWHCDLDKSKGVDIGNTYNNDHAAKEFTKAIAEVERQKITDQISQSSFLSILCDGSTDAAVIDNELVYIRLVCSGSVNTFFIGCMHVDKANADGILAAIKRAVVNMKMDWNHLVRKVVAMGSDGASVMIGCRRGVAALMRQENSSIITVHCFAHRLELAFKDAIFKISLGDKLVNTLLMGLYYFYHNSPLNKSSLKNSFRALGVKIILPTRVGGTRWVGHIQRALVNLFQGYPAITQHLHQLQASGDNTTAKSKAKGLLRLLEDVNIMTFAGLVYDVLSGLVIMSKTFQKKDGTAADIHRSLENVVTLLDKYQTRDGPYLQKVKSGQFNLTAAPTAQFDAARAQLLSQLDSSLKARFADTGKGVIKASAVLDFAMWPFDTESMQDFGDESIATVVTHYKSSLRDAGVDLDVVQVEWDLLKADIHSCFSKELENGTLNWSQVNRTFKAQYDNILSVINLLLCLPSSSAECERGFSLMKKIKTNIRNCLGEESMCDTMVIGLHSQPIQSFDPVPAIHLWNSAAQRKRQPFFNESKKMKVTSDAEQLTGQSQSESASSAPDSDVEDDAASGSESETECIVNEADVDMRMKQYML